MGLILQAISDTHELHLSMVPLLPCDVLIHSGDATNNGLLSALSDFAHWFASQPARYHVFVAGNHDRCFEDDPIEARRILRSNGIIYLQDSAAIIEGLRFWGVPWQPEFCNWSFNLPRGELLARKYGVIPDDTNVLITHGPPAGIGDNRLGCVDLTNRIYELSSLKAHVCGHIHEGYGSRLVDGIRFVNAATCDGRYRPVNQPIRFEVQP